MNARLAFVAEVLGEKPLSPETRQWLRQGFESHVKFNEPLANALCLDDFARGLPDAYRHKRRKEYLFKALDLIDDGKCTINSIAQSLASDLNRILTRARPKNEYERLLSDALDAHPSASNEAKNLWYLVKERRSNKRPVHI
jgi:hypothetical protein